MFLNEPINSLPHEQYIFRLYIVLSFDCSKMLYNTHHLGISSCTLFNDFVSISFSLRLTTQKRCKTNGKFVNISENTCAHENDFKDS